MVKKGYVIYFIQGVSHVFDPDSDTKVTPADSIVYMNKEDATGEMIRLNKLRGYTPETEDIYVVHEVYIKE